MSSMHARTLSNCTHCGSYLPLHFSASCSLEYACLCKFSYTSICLPCAVKQEHKFETPFETDHRVYCSNQHRNRRATRRIFDNYGQWTRGSARKWTGFQRHASSFVLSIHVLEMCTYDYFELEVIRFLCLDMLPSSWYASFVLICSLARTQTRVWGVCIIFSSFQAKDFISFLRV